jgi:hypothetical protein
MMAAWSQRHVSFLELGRSKPSREMVLRLFTALEVPLRHSNELLRAAGVALHGISCSAAVQQHASRDRAKVVRCDNRPAKTICMSNVRRQIWRIHPHGLPVHELPGTGRRIEHGPLISRAAIRSFQTCAGDQPASRARHAQQTMAGSRRHAPATRHHRAGSQAAPGPMSQQRPR